ncbi:mitochondrial chaperone BCS1 [Rhizoctonia solani]|uniref:Mitochondrial chaperone BCS1 n=1 Tax=Rhizoctonia solani TaxID=456999 RepID=A0A8H8ST56_9AGAM|nr:mitochondrial chaperone BCS1 [Rhizoctonia solani]QRW16724.1 mitochondrial chaperone BCS1 [Rhizoctonia solani]
MDTLKNLLVPGSNALQDTLRLVVIGGAVETARRTGIRDGALLSIHFTDELACSFLTATFMQDDYPYDWVMHWLSKQPAWSRAREFEITTRNADSSRLGVKTPTDQEFEEDEEFGLVDDDEQLVHGRRKRKVALTPSADTTHNIYYRGHWLRVRRKGNRIRHSADRSRRNNAIIKKLVLQAKYEYEQDMEHRVHIFLADQGGGWRWNGARHKRPMSSIVLEPGVKDMLLTDAKDFLRSEDWYAERGIPFRRGYLLHGVPGSGKTSLIHALAGELGLDIYVVSLNMKGMSDNTLANLMGRIPQRCILLEDLDAAFTRGTSRDTKSTGAPTAKTAAETKADDPNTLSLSGLLNCLDGRLDPALSRPGRMDVWVDFKNASRWQAEEIFKNFFPSKPPVTRRRAHPRRRRRSREEASCKPSSRYTALVPLLDVEEISELAKRFAQHIPEDELSVASLQGYLLKNKTRPREKERLEKEEAEEKEKKEKEEKEKKEKEEKREKRKKEKEEKLEKERKLKLEQEARNARRQSRTSSSSTSVTASTSSATTGTTNSTATTDSETSDDESDAATTKTRTTTNSTESQSTEPSGSKWVNVKGATGGPVSTAGIIESVTDLIA